MKTSSNEMFFTNVPGISYLTHGGYLSRGVCLGGRSLGFLSRGLCPGAGGVLIQFYAKLQQLNQSCWSPFQ